ncbi:MAG TPA: GH3 auxin-responsive promoter family protein, partial [Chitinophagales bacterium]|nr:GH3 auxin-responsive promoter family protein [Chitinophagales bacterium]
MRLKSLLIRPYARHVVNKVAQWSSLPFEAQDRTLKALVSIAAGTAFGKTHRFDAIKNYADFKKAVPLRNYEQLVPFIDRIINGEKNVLWPGKPVYFAKSSGTTAGVKFIPITRDSLKNHFYTAQTALLMYMVETRTWRIMDGKMIFLSGSPVLERVGGIPAGRLSGIVNHQIPAYLKANQLPSWETNCIEDWETKLDNIVDETVSQNMTLISGIPPWMQMYFDKLRERTGKPVRKIFPNLQVLVHGGVNFEPYRAKLEVSIGEKIQTLETYPASEGFIAFQDTAGWKGLLLNADSGIFYEFVRAENIFDENPDRFSLKDVETGVHYAIIINSNAGLWGYVLGDTVKFVTKNPYRIAVTGRISHFISAFGEHVIAEEVEQAMKEAVAGEEAVVTEFTVAPQITPLNGGLPCHEWLIEFEKPPADLRKFSARLDLLMCA